MKDQAIANARVSTPEQKLNNSLNRQEESVLKAAVELDVEVVKWWSGNVSSKAGTNIKRKDLQEMLAYCKAHKRVKYLIVDEPDRFMRSIDEAAYFEVLFKQEAGVTVWYACDPNLNTADLSAKLLKFSKYFSAEGSNAGHQMKVIGGHNKAIAEGRYPFPPMPGYMKGTKAGVHIPHPEQFKTLQQAFREVISGLYTPSEALKRLNQSDFTKSRAPWKIDKFNMFAMRPYYAGVIELDKQVKARCETGRHQPMLTTEEHDALKAIITGRKRPVYERQKDNPEFPLSKTLCHDCGGRLVGFQHTNGKGWTKPKYRCRGCGKQYHRHIIHEALDAVLDPLQVDADSKGDFMAALSEAWEQRQQDNLKHHRSLVVQLEGLKQTKHQLTIEMASNAARRADIEEALDEVKGQINELEDEIAKVTEYQNDLVEFVAFALEVTNDLKSNWWQLTHEKRVQCKQLLFPEDFSVGRDEKVYTPKISALYRFAATKKTIGIDRKSLLVELMGIAPTAQTSHV